MAGMMHQGRTDGQGSRPAPARVTPAAATIARRGPGRPRN